MNFVNKHHFLGKSIFAVVSALLTFLFFCAPLSFADGRLPDEWRNTPERIAEFQQPVAGADSAEMLNTLFRQNIIPIGKFIFIGVGLLFFAMYAYRIALGTGDDDQFSEQRSNLLFAMLGFLIIALAAEAVEIINPLRSGDTSQILDQNQVDSVVQTIVNVLELSLGTIAIAVIFYGGIRMITANGDEERVKEGRNMLLYGFLGFIFVMLANPLVTEIFYPSLGNQTIGTEQATSFIVQGFGILKFLLQFVAIIIFIAFLYSGFMFLFGGLNDDQTEQAKRTLIWTVVGFIVVIISYSLVLFFLPS